MSPLFYERIFADVGINPSACLVVDDKPEALEWAREAGAGVTVLIDPAVQPYPHVDAVISSLAALPSKLPTLVA